MPRISIYEGGELDNNPRVPDLSWSELQDLLAVPRVAACAPCIADLAPEEQLQLKVKSCPHKDGLAWSPATLRSGTTRSSESVVELAYLVVDLDHLSVAQVVDVVGRAEGLDYVLHSTHSHRARVSPRRLATPLGQKLAVEDCCLRLVLRPSRLIHAAEFPQLWRAVADYFGVADEQCKDLSRLYFLPSATEAQLSEFVFVRGEGEPVDVDALLARAVLAGAQTHAPPLASAPAFAVEPPRPVSEQVQEGSVDADLDDPVAIDLEALRARLKEVRRRKARRGDDKYDLLDRVIRGKVFCVPGWAEGTDAELRARGLEKGRQCAIHRAASVVAFSLPPGTPVEAAIELLRPSLEQSEVAPEGLQHWLDVASQSYGEAMAEREARDDERRAMDAALRDAFNAMAPNPGAVLEAARQLEAVPPEEGAALATWKDLLLFKKGEELRQCSENAFTVLALDERTRGTISFDVVEKTIRVSGGPFEGVKLEVLDGEVAGWLSRHWDLNLSSGVVGESILRVAYASPTDPLREYLHGLKWDGEDRVDCLLTRYASAVTKSRTGLDVFAYVSDVGRKTLIGAVARALDPGCQMDTVLVLEGEQGEGKTSFCRILGGQWASTTTLVLDDKDTKQLVSTTWISELGELRSLRSTDENAMKSFITEVEDRFRPPFGKVPVRFPRRCVFFGTVDEYTYLKKRDRRIWPVHCGEFDLDGLRRDRDQVWAQAVEYYRRFCSERDRGVHKDANPWRWWMSKRERHAMVSILDERIESTHYELKIAEWWAGKKNRPGQLTTSQVAEEVLRIPTERVNHGVQTEVGLAMKKLGFEKKRGLVAGHQTWYYEPSEVLRDAPFSSSGTSYISLVANAKFGKK